MINLADVLAASNGQYDNVVNVLSLAQPVTAALFVCFLVFVVCKPAPHLRAMLVSKVAHVVSGVLLVVTLVYLIVPYNIIKQSNPTVVDVVEASYDVQALSTSESPLSTYHFVDNLNKAEAVQVTFNDSGCVLNAIVVTDDSSNVYVIDADTNEIVQPKVSNSEEVAKLLSEKYQS